MKFIVDQCAGRRIAQWLEKQGHDVTEVRTMIPDPGDSAILQQAGSEGRVLVTRDKGFGKRVHRDLTPHAGIIQIPNVSVERRIDMVGEILEKHRDALRDHSFITVDWSGRIRVANDTEAEEPRGRFGLEISQARERMGLKQHELARKIGISTTYLSDIERGRRRPLRGRMLKRLARDLNLDVDLLWFRAGRIPPEILNTDPSPDRIRQAMNALRAVLGAAPRPGKNPDELDE